MLAASTVGTGIDLSADRAVVNQALREVVGSPGGKGIVAEAMRYAVLGAGQRIRPILALRVARSVHSGDALTLRAAVAVEILHAASLIVDDLPSMDDEKLRRGRPTVHRAFGEATALLAAFALVALSARTLLEERRSREDLPGILDFQRHLLGTLDCSSLIAGQALDLGLPEGPGKFDLHTVASLKTVPLFELAARAGVISASSAGDDMAKIGRAFGMAFQLVDDYMDGDLEESDAAISQIETLRSRLSALPRNGDLMELVDYLDERLWETNRSHR